MKLGVVYNVFDGTELLQKSLDSIRSEVDFVGAVFQKVSNFGNPIDTHFEKLFAEIGIDNWKLYSPSISNKSPSWNEIQKRNIGLEMAATYGCTHFMTMDCDEAYDLNQFREAKREIEYHRWDSSCCKMLTYYKNFEYVLDPPEEYYVPFIYTIDGRRFHEPTFWSVIADPTRKLPEKRNRIFDRSELQMHHYSWIRNDLRTKLMNSSAKSNWAGDIDGMVKHYENWKPGDKAYCSGRYLDLRKI